MALKKQCSERDCTNCVQSVDHLFQGLPPAVLQDLNAHKLVHHYTRGQAVFYAGNPPNGLYCVSSGLIKIESLSADGKTHLLRVVKAGGVLGYRSLFSNEPYHATAIVSEDADICMIPREYFLKLIHEAPELMLRIVSRLSTELREAESRIESHADKEAPERIAEAVLYFKDHFPNHNWTRKELGEWAGTSPETVMRVLGKLESEKVLSLQGRLITILDRKKLLLAANLPG